MEWGSVSPVLNTVRIHPWLRLLRPLQWAKNAVVLAPLVFSREFNDAGAVIAAIVALIAFCLTSSATYIVNDWLDADRDRHHPSKQARPLASREIAIVSALSVAAALALTAFVLAAAISSSLVLVLVAYILLTSAYSVWFKKIVIVDVVVIAMGFLLRAVAGGVAIGVTLSVWLMVCTALLALFLGFSKRRNEIITLEEAALRHRASLRNYSPRILDVAIVLALTTTIAAYAMYTFTAESVPESGAMLVTVPIVAFSMFRYLYLVYVRKLGGAPETLLFQDFPLLASILLWGITVLAVFWLA